MIVGLLGMLFESALIRPLYKRIPEYTLLLTFGTALIFAQIVRQDMGRRRGARRDPELHPRRRSTSARYALPFYKDVFLVVVTIVILAGVWLLLNKTNIGIIIRAGTRDAEMVKILGINMPLMFTFVFGIGSLMAGLAGALAAPIYAIQPNLASQWIVLTFVIVIVGGIGSFWGAIVGGLLIGILSSLMALILAPAVERDRLHHHGDRAADPAARAVRRGGALRVTPSSRRPAPRVPHPPAAVDRACCSRSCRSSPARTRSPGSGAASSGSRRRW